MDKRLERIFEESRNRHLKKKEKKKAIIKKTKKLQNEEIKRAQTLIYQYRWHDKKRFNNKEELEAQWIVDNIFSKPCVYCGETDWHELGCDRINNSKPHTPDNVIPCCKRCNRIRGNIFTVDEMKEIGAVIRKIENRHRKYRLRNSKRVISYDDNNIIKHYTSASQTQEDGFSPRMVRRACEKNSSGYTYKGLYWKYID